MGLRSFIRIWLEDVKQTTLIYKLVRKNPGDLAAISDTIKTNELAHLKYMMGHAITQWALMEERLIMVATLLLRTKPEKTGLIFFSIINFQVWLAVITDLFKLEPEFSDLQRRWNKIYERLRAEKDNRDRIAHHYAMSADVSDNPVGRAITKAHRMDMRAKSLASKPMTVEQVEAFADRVGAIGDDLGNLTDDMLKHGGAG
jgi:hypothetical protein